MRWTLEELIGAFRCSFVPVQVLVVDDDLTARAAMRRMLEHHGYSVIVAECGEDALELVERTQTPIDLLLTAVSMPGLSGVDLAACLRARIPALPVVFVSPDPAEQARLDGAVGSAWFVEKPFLPAELLGAVHGAMGIPHSEAGEQAASTIG